MTKTKLHSMVSPIGVAVWPKLQKPDTKFKPLGEYMTGLRLLTEDPATQKFIAELDAQYDQALELAREKNPKHAKNLKKADKPFKAEVDEEGNETGHTVFNFKMAARVEPKDKAKEGWDQRPDLFDAKLNPLVTNKRIAGGSTIRVSFEVMPFFVPALGAGISLRLRGVQILNLVEFAARDAKSLGFDAQDGFDSTSMQAGDEEGSADSTEGGGDADDEHFN